MDQTETAEVEEQAVVLLELRLEMVEMADTLEAEAVALAVLVEHSKEAEVMAVTAG